MWDKISPEAVDALIAVVLILVLCITGLIANMIVDRRQARRIEKILGMQEALLRASTAVERKAQTGLEILVNAARAKQKDRQNGH